MDLGVDGKVVVVTAGSKGIGIAATQTLADEGAPVNFFSEMRACQAAIPTI